MKVEVLISCMHQKDTSIIKRSNVQTDVVVVNQCDLNNCKEFSFCNKYGEECHAVFISTTERGLSRSRNMALRNASGDVCLICDDDEVFDDDYAQTILKEFEKNPDIDIFAFQIRNSCKYMSRRKRLGYIGALKLASWQISFRLDKIRANGINFDETLGSGVSKAGGEENKFLYDCLNKGLKIVSTPSFIGNMTEGASQWFHGFTSAFFYDRGIMTRKLMGKPLAALYGAYYILRKFPEYHNDISPLKAASNLIKGLFS